MSLIYEPEPAHWCLDELATVAGENRSPWDGLAGGSIAQCTCGRYYVIDERTGLWRRISKRSRVVREALAHQEERRSR
jgi:hypothetical protein